MVPQQGDQRQDQASTKIEVGPEVKDTKKTKEGVAAGVAGAAVAKNALNKQKGEEQKKSFLSKGLGVVKSGASRLANGFKSLFGSKDVNREEDGAGGQKTGDALSGSYKGNTEHPEAVNEQNDAAN